MINLRLHVVFTPRKRECFKIKLNGMLITIILLSAVLSMIMTGTACKKKATVEERLTWERIQPMIDWLEDFHIANQNYPDNFQELLAFKGQPMPTNPYTNQPMVSLESGEFDRTKSPGNFFYARVLQDDQVVNYQLLVFGSDGIKVRFSHEPDAVH
jgi:hypothetical protein